MLNCAVGGLLVAAAIPSSAGAAKITLGSSLVPSASVIETNPRDWMAYPTAQADGTEFRVQTTGEVAWVDLKGSIVEQYAGYPRPDVVLHVVVTRPLADGRDELIVSTENLPLPYGGDPQQVNSFNLQALDARICVRPGDHIALATSGGFGNQFPQYGSYPDDFYKDGAPFRMFGRVAGSSVAVFKQPADEDTGEVGGSYQVGDKEFAVPRQGVELLMRAVVGTGPDARFFCRTPAEQAEGFPNPGQAPNPDQPSPALNPIDLPVPEHDPHVSSKGIVPIRVYCRATAGCKGTLTLTRGAKVVATTALDIPTKTTGRPRLKLAKGARKALRRRGSKISVTATVTLDTGYTIKQALRLVRKGG